MHSHKINKREQNKDWQILNGELVRSINQKKSEGTIPSLNWDLAAKYLFKCDIQDENTGNLFKSIGHTRYIYKVALIISLILYKSKSALTL